MTKFIALLCAASMVLGVSATAFAADEDVASEEVAVTETAETEATDEAAEEADEETAEETAEEAAAEEAVEETEATEETAEEEAEAPTPIPFVDVDPGSYYADAVDFCSVNGLFNGVSDDEFAPDLTMTRGMFATVFGRLQNADLSNVTLTYADVKVDAYYAPYIAWATEQGIMDGYSDEEFGPDDAITREQAAKMLYAYATKVVGMSIADVPASYTDADSVSDWAEEAVVANAAIGYLIADENGNINPQAAITRADACYAVAITVEAGNASQATDAQTPAETETVSETDADTDADAEAPAVTETEIETEAETEPASVSEEAEAVDGESDAFVDTETETEESPVEEAPLDETPDEEAPDEDAPSED